MHIYIGMHEYTNKTNNGVEITDDGIHSLYWFSVAVYTAKIFFFFEMTTPINAYGGFFLALAFVLDSLIYKYNIYILTTGYKYIHWSTVYTCY